jgi:hypothetical protein
MAPTKYGDLYKPVKDLFTKNFTADVDGRKFEGKFKTEDGVTISPKVEVTDKSKTSVDFEFPSKVGSLLSYGLKLGLTDASIFQSELKMNAFSFIDGTAVTLKADLDLSSKPAKDDKTSFEVDYGNSAFTSVAKYEISSKNGANATTFTDDVSFAVNDNIKVGAQFRVNPSFTSLDGYTAALQYKADSLTVAAEVNDFFYNAASSVKVGAVQKLSSELQAGVEAGVKTDKSGSTSTSLVTVGEYKFDADTTIKARFNSSAVVAVAVQYKLSKFLKAGFGVEGSALGGNKKVGISFNYEN